MYCTVTKNGKVQQQPSKSRIHCVNSNLDSIQTLTQLQSIFVWCPKEDYYVTSGSALQSFHSSNYTVWIQTLFFCFAEPAFKPPEVTSLESEIRIALIPEKHFIRDGGARNARHL